MKINDSLIFDVQTIQKIYNEYQIKLEPNMDSLYIQILNFNSYKVYDNNFNLEYLLNNKLLSANYTIIKIIEFINGLIEQKNIKIEEKKNELKLILISTSPTVSNVELILNQNNIISYELFEKLVNEVKIIQNENKILKKNYDKLYKLSQLFIIIIVILNYFIFNFLYNNIKAINNKIHKLEVYKIKEMNNYNFSLQDNIVQNISNINNELKEYDTKVINSIYQNITFPFHQIDEISNKQNDSSEKELKIKNKTKINLKNIHSISSYYKGIRGMSQFPSGNIISVYEDKSIIIYNNNFTIFQIIENAHDDFISYVDIKNDNNFVTSSYDNTIKTWIKKNNIFEINQIIPNAHDSWIRKIIYNSKGDLISCSLDGKIKIWKMDNNTLNNKTINHLNKLNSILLIEDKNILISSGNGTKFFDLNNYQLIISFNDTFCRWNNAIERLDNDTIIVQGYNSNNLKIISISQKKIIKEIIFNNICSVIKSIKNKGLFLIGDWDSNINVYRNDNYTLEQIIKKAHFDKINGIIQLKNDLIVSFSSDNKIKIWSF